METVSQAVPEDSSGANPSSVKSDDSSPRNEGGRGSPPPNCAICLGTCKNKSFTDSCLHQFCFKCLLTWSKVKAECPLCKQNFKSIIHNVRSNHQYEEYMVEQRETEETIERLDNDGSYTRRFRYRTTLTLPRHESITIRELLTQYPLTAELFPPPAPAPRRRPSPASFRRTVYRHRLWARPLPDFTGRFRDCTPEFYRYNDTQMHRLVPWLNRELHYLLNENVGHISYVISRILELLPRYHITSPEFREAVQVYFRDRTEHFLHELYCFASTPYDMTGYDRYVQYTTDTRISTMVNEVISSSESEGSVDSDIVMVSSSEPAEPPPGPSRVPSVSRIPGPSRLQASSRIMGPSRAPEPVYPQNYISEPTTNNNVITIESISHSDTDDDSSEVMVVGYIKPPQDRTPEVVDLLGSDSDVILQDTVPSEPTANTQEAQENRPTPSVKLTLKRHIMYENDDSDSDESVNRSSAVRRRRRQRSNDTATTSDTCRTTPSPASEWQPTSESLTSLSSCTSLMSPSTDATSTSDNYNDSSTDSDTSSSSSKRNKILKRKTKRKSCKECISTGKDKKRSKTKRTSRTHHKDKQSIKLEKDKPRKRKSHSSKTGKSSKKNESSNAPVTTSIDTDQPSTSGISSNHKHRSRRERNRRPTNYESKRLKSVVNVMYNKNNGESSGTCKVLNSAVTNSNPNTLPEKGLVEEETSSVINFMKNNEDSDSEDNLPLNLTVQKTS
ncbi:E3 ubiquitin-protein ligase Topors-like [Galleria mellonella]|uniref:E3 ubiquitin-protein ligase Topors n=1 Tax=Galleria mellonella TaxID=7137 RepID=A0A6J1WTI3_GALME|nr:E3 ubiquitin-protein ligase Topors-like [Galleria mellonella]